MAMASDGEFQTFSPMDMTRPVPLPGTVPFPCFHHTLQHDRVLPVTARHWAAHPRLNTIRLEPGLEVGDIALGSRNITQLLGQPFMQSLSLVPAAGNHHTINAVTHICVPHQGQIGPAVDHHIKSFSHLTS